jgi:photosystem II stability/assembly factor-like uncharacterized protein
MKTINSGLTWTRSSDSVPAAVYHSVYFTDANTGYIAGWNSSGGLVLKTIDGGTTWSSKSSGTPQGLNSVYFISPETGYVVGKGGIIQKTMDGGTTWTTQYPSSGVGYVLNSVCFPDANTGYVAGYFSGFDGGGVILKTTDGGSTWNPSCYPVDSLLSVNFINITTGYAVGSYGTIYKTTDGGSTWIVQLYGTGGHKLNSVFFTDANTGYTVGDHGTILKTINGGGTVGIFEKQQTNNLKIYPNPATEKITIKPSGTESNRDGTVSVYGITGKELLQKNVQGSSIEINIGSLPQGIYFIRFKDKGKTESGKFIKE